MADGGMVRFELGFRSGGSTGGLIAEDQWELLQKALLGGSDEIVELTGADQQWLLRSGEVAWVRRSVDGGRRLGFGG